MFSFIKKLGKNSELEGLIARIESNVANNYKDAAQDYLKQYETRLSELTDAGTLNEKQKEYYGTLLEGFHERMKGFTHKEQTPYWT